VPVKIIVTEDEQDILTQYRLVLEGKDRHVVTTANGEECLNVYMAELKKQALPFDAVVLDHRMPKIDGMEFAKHVLAANPAYVN
jgi:CheY-like chemotaxis protein